MPNERQTGSSIEKQKKRKAVSRGDGREGGAKRHPARLLVLTAEMRCRTMIKEEEAAPMGREKRTGKKVPPKPPPAGAIYSGPKERRCRGKGGDATGSRDEDQRRKRGTSTEPTIGSIFHGEQLADKKPRGGLWSRREERAITHRPGRTLGGELKAHHRQEKAGGSRSALISASVRESDSRLSEEGQEAGGRQSLPGNKGKENFDKNGRLGSRKWTITNIE